MSQLLGQHSSLLIWSLCLNEGSKVLHWHLLGLAEATALPGLDSALQSSCAKLTPQYHCMYMQHVTALQAHRMYGKPLDKLRHRQGRADSNSPSRSGLCPAIIMCQTNTTVSLHVHAACHNTVSSLNEWEASLQTQAPPRQGRQQQPFQVWTLPCYHHVPN